MTPYEFATKECANMQANKSCLGVRACDLAYKGRQRFAAELPRCLLSEKPIHTCKYFEKIVMPLADNPSPKDKPGLQKSRAEARELYLGQTAQVQEDKKRRPCPDCGEVLPKGKKYCESCSIKRRRVSYRNRRYK